MTGLEKRGLEREREREREREGEREREIYLYIYILYLSIYLHDGHQGICFVLEQSDDG